MSREEQVAAIERSLADPEFGFRWNKDKEARQRIDLFKKHHKPKRRAAVKVMPKRKGSSTVLKGLRT